MFAQGDYIKADFIRPGADFQCRVVQIMFGCPKSGARISKLTTNSILNIPLYTVADIGLHKAGCATEIFDHGNGFISSIRGNVEYQKF